MAEKKKTETRKRGLMGSVIKSSRPPKKKPAEVKKDVKTEKAAAPVKEDVKAKKVAEDKSVKAKSEAAAAKAAAAKKTVPPAKPEKAVESPKAEKAPLAEPREGFTVFQTESGAYETKLNKMFSRRKPWEPENPKQILSFMPGTVGEIKVKKGQKVEEGEELMIFRAMKMNNIMMAPVAGKVKAINVKEGDNVSKNTVMIELS